MTAGVASPDRLCYRCNRIVTRRDPITRKSPPADDLRARIRGAKLRVTHPRLSVLRELEKARTPLSHSDLVQSLAGEGLDRVTIYRNLNDLAAAGLVRRADLGDHVWRFELRRGEADHEQSEHPHFVCNACGDVQCLPAESLRIDVAKRAPRALRKRRFQVQLRGECDRCS
jgi:Fur family ferric uptake transcriptional regulator